MPLQYEIPVAIPTGPALKLEIVGNDFPFHHLVNGAELPEKALPAVPLENCDSPHPGLFEKFTFNEVGMAIPKTELCCDNCGKPYPNGWSRCIHCAHYFCSDCHPDHGCRVKFKSWEQLQEEAIGRTATSKLALIRDLSQLNKTYEQIAQSTGCSADMVEAYIRHLNRKPSPKAISRS